MADFETPCCLQKHSGGQGMGVGAAPQLELDRVLGSCFSRGLRQGPPSESFWRAGQGEVRGHFVSWRRRRFQTSTEHTYIVVEFIGHSRSQRAHKISVCSFSAWISYAKISMWEANIWCCSFGDETAFVPTLRWWKVSSSHTAAKWISQWWPSKIISAGHLTATLLVLCHCVVSWCVHVWDFRLSFMYMSMQEHERGLQTKRYAARSLFALFDWQRWLEI